MTAPNIPRRWWVAAVLGIGAAAVLPGVGRLLRRMPERRCALDGAEVDPTYMVQIVAAEQDNRLQFCSLFCAERWLQASGAQPKAVFVTDEKTGEEISASAAFYVRSRVIAHEPTGERRHVFGSQGDAQRHAAEHFGRVLDGEDRPFGYLLD